MKKLFFGLFLVGFIIGSIRLYATYFCIVKNYICFIDTCLSDECRAFIEHAVAENASKNAGACEIIEVLQKKFPLIRKVVITYSPHEARVVVQAHRPKAIINDSFVFTHHNHIFSKTDFFPSIVSVVPTVHIFQESMPEASQLLSCVFAQLPAHFYNTYDLVICDKHCLKLMDKQQSHFSIKFSLGQSIDPAILMQCEQVKKIVIRDNGFDKNTEWVADVRFADYLIAYKT